ncbi:hypothetical protein QTP70_000659 [Hemibagrus guttatus]|uniref:ribonuclease H n=1 Tax=Hemibagrus guttatus TaxID=175788 RepID=A0AAE0UUL7_9TELE|nr:hypothetical protein QTP70_000659 [Hemibagrus guttatus]
MTWGRYLEMNQTLKGTHHFLGNTEYVFVDLEKAYDRVPREELWYCMRKSGVAEKYVRVVQDMYERSRTVVRCAVGQTEEFNVELGLHQGSALSPFLFAIVMNQLSEEVRQESPWTMMFADDIVICSESREQVEENLERWRFALERRGMKVSRSKTEYMCVNEREGSGTVRLQGEEVKKVQEFKYLGSTVQSNGECGKEVKKRVQAGWNGWRKVSGVLCDQKISARIKGKVYRTVVRPAMLYGLETVSLRKRQESELEVAELKMLRFSLGVTRLDRIRNEYIRGTAHVGRLGDKVREARLRWLGHVQRRENFYIWLPVVYSVICAVGLTGNTAVIYVILKAPKMKTVTNLFILNLAIADDLFTLVLPINIAEHLLNYWPFGELLCKVILSIDHYNIFSSIYFLTVMSADRYLVVISTLQSKRMPHRTYRFAKIISVCVWALVVLIVAPFTFFAGIYVSPDDAENRKSCVLSFPSPESFWFKASRIYTLVFSFILPVSTICVLYSLMLYKLRHTHLNSNGKALDKAKKKVTVMVFVVLAVCLFCWTPFHLSTVVALTTDLPTTPLVIGISYFITGLSYANSCLNPFLYAFLDDSFRKAFKKMLDC